MPKQQTIRFMLCWALLTLAPLAKASAREIVIDNYRNGLAAGWKTKSFAGQTPLYGREK
ncbi:MAG: hypothetical protein OEV91_04250 [Desulfobulbaceae bacterium]|nr:hypothetical protein [Desulfobulbaceae bacterium]